MTAVGAERAGVILEAASRELAIRYPSVPLADDPELAGHALWNEEIAEDLEEMTLEWEASHPFQPFQDLPDIADYREPDPRDQIVCAHTARLAAQAQEKAAITAALRSRSVPQAEKANEARTELARLAALTEAAAFAYRGAIRELHESGMSYARIGAALGISRGTVQKHMEWERRNGG